MLLVFLSAATGAVGGFMASRWMSSLRKTPKTYPQFESLEALQRNLWSDAAKAVAKKDGEKNLKVLEAAGLLGKTWPIRMNCQRWEVGSGAPVSGSKVIHFIRHGQGFHNSLADFCKVFEVQLGSINLYHTPEMFDPPLTEIGRQQAMALRSYTQRTAPKLVAVSPMSRSLMTSNLAYEHLIGKIPFIAHEGCKEKCHGNACDMRRAVSYAKADFPNVDFSLVDEEDPMLSRNPDETDLEVAQRAYDFMLWIQQRPEQEIVVSTHSAWLFNLFNVVLKCDPPELAEWFVNGELRSVRVDFG